MITETIYGQIVAKANHYMSVPGKNGKKRIIKDEKIRAYEKSFIQQCRAYKGRRISSRFRLFVRVYHSSVRFDLDNSLKTLLDCLQMVGAIEDDKLCFQIEAEKHIDKYRPRSNLYKDENEHTYEYYPRDSQFGKSAWCIRDGQHAQKKIQKYMQRKYE